MVEDEAMRRLDVEDEYCGVKRDRCVKDGAVSGVMLVSALKCLGTFSVSFLAMAGVCPKCFSEKVLDSACTVILF